VSKHPLPESEASAPVASCAASDEDAPSYVGPPASIAARPVPPASSACPESAPEDEDSGAGLEQPAESNALVQSAARTAEARKKPQS
jgi:hypothetical protein